jgi:hypothetical protein
MDIKKLYIVFLKTISYFRSLFTSCNQSDTYIKWLGQVLGINEYIEDSRVMAKFRFSR